MLERQDHNVVIIKIKGLNVNPPERVQGGELGEKLVQEGPNGVRKAGFSALNLK